MSEQDVKKVEKLLTGLGYELPKNHAEGKADAALGTVIKKAVGDIKGLMNITVEGDDFTKLRSQFDAGIQKANKPGSDFATLKSAYQTLGETGIDALLGAAGKNVNIPEHIKDHFNTVIDFVDNYKNYKTAITNVEADIKTPAAAPIKPANTSPSSGDNQESIKRFQKIMAHAFPDQNIQPTGTWDKATQAAYLKYAEEITGQSADKLTINTINAAAATKLKALKDEPQDTPEWRKQTAILSTFSILSPHLTPLFKGTLAEVAPPKAQASVQAESTQDPKILSASLMVEKFLSNEKLVKFVNETGQQIDQNWTFSQPTDAADLTLDAGSQAALQQLLGVMTKYGGLGLEEFRTNEGPVPYTPQLGQKILQGLEKTQNPKMREVRAMLEQNIPEMEDPQNPGVKKKGAAALIAQLDYLYLHNVLERQARADASIPEMDPMQMGILKFVFGFINQMFPNLIPMLDGLARQYTGAGLTDLVPALGMIDGVQEKLGGLDQLDPHEQLVESFKRSFKDTKGAAAREDMKEALMKAAATMSNLPFGSEGRRKNYPAAVSQALDAAMVEMGDLKPGDEGFNAALDKASQAYATTFIDAMKTLDTKHGGPDFQDNPPFQLYPPEILRQNLSASGFDIDNNAKVISDDEIDKIVTTYNNMNYGESSLYNHKPLIFTDNSGKTYIAGIDQKSNMFTIQHLDIKAINEALDAGQPIETIKSAHPAYAFADENYRPYFNNAMKVNGSIKYDRAITYMAGNPNIARPFARIDHDAQAHKDDTQLRAQVEYIIYEDTKNKEQERHFKNRVKLARKKKGLTGYEDCRPEEKFLEFAPQTGSKQGGSIYVDSRVDPKMGAVLGQRSFRADVTDELAKFSELNAAQRGYYDDKPELMREHFPELSTVAAQYPQYDNAFDLADKLVKHYDLHTKAIVPPLKAAMPQWLQDMLDDPDEQRSLEEATKNGIKMYKPKGGHVYIVGKGDSQQRPFIAYDVGEELEKFAQLDSQQRDAVFTSHHATYDQFPHLTEIADQYAFDTKALADSLLRKDSVTQELGIKQTPYDSAAAQPHTPQAVP